MLDALRQSLANQPENPSSDCKKPRGAVAVLFKEEVNDLWLLMIKRSENPRDPWSGQMAFPGGHADERDRTLLDTAVRETLEEVEVNMQDQELLGHLRDVQPKNAPMIVTPFLFLLLSEVHPTSSQEAKEVLWVPMSFLLDPKNISSVKVAIGDQEVLMGCYVYSNHVIWGMSFRIIRDMISMITKGAE